MATVVTYPQYWVSRLTGRPVNEATSLGCHTDLWAPGAGDFSSLVDRLGLGAKMAPVRRAADRIGPVLPEVAARTGLGAGDAGLCGIHDSQRLALPAPAAAGGAVRGGLDRDLGDRRWRSAARRWRSIRRATR